MPENKKEQIDEELSISILLENFNYSGTKDGRGAQSSVSKFYGRVRERARMLVHSFRVKNQSGSFSALADDRSGQNGVPKFFGRTREKDRLLDRLGKGKNRGGSFLIAGYRGVGKTRFVDEVLQEYEKDVEFIEVRVNLGNDADLTSKSVLFNMVYLLNNSLRNTKQVRFLRFLFGNIIRSLSLAIVFLLALFGLILVFPGLGIYKSDFIYWSTYLLPLCIPIWILIHFGDFPYLKTWKAFIKLKRLQQKIYSTIDGHAEIKSNFFGFGKRRVTTPLTTNQIEAQLKDILLILEDENVIFIFDELDKLSGKASDNKDTNLDLTKESKLRKQQVDSILGDLKNLITDSNARYIFIAGRDMYDAYLSERGSSNSLYESL
ncbi:MAG: ATP-binding protein, partial [Bacteroidota bacterium]